MPAPRNFLARFIDSSGGLSSYEPSWRDRLAQLLTDPNRPVSMERERMLEGLIGSAGISGDAGLSIMDAVPGMGMAALGVDAMEALAKGNMGRSGGAVAEMAIPFGVGKGLDRLGDFLDRGPGLSLNLDDARLARELSPGRSFERNAVAPSRKERPMKYTPAILPNHEFSQIESTAQGLRQARYGNFQPKYQPPSPSDEFISDIYKADYTVPSDMARRAANLNSRRAPVRRHLRIVDEEDAP